MKTKHILVALGTAVLCSGVAILSAMSVGPKPCTGSNSATTPSLYQQGEKTTKDLSAYGDFADLRLSSKGVWILSWRGQVPASAQSLIETELAPLPVVSREVPYSKAQLDSAKKDLYLKFAELNKQGLIMDSYAHLRLDGESFEVGLNVPNAENVEAVVAQVKAVTEIPVAVPFTSNLVVYNSIPQVDSFGCRSIAL